MLVEKTEKKVVDRERNLLGRYIKDTETVYKKCVICGKNIKTYQCLKNRKKYCSFKCRNIGLKSWTGKKRYNYKGGFIIAYKKRLKVITKYRKKCMKSWMNYISQEANCGICGKKIFFKGHGKAETICFDHRYENCKINENPSHWLGIRLMNEKNKKIWDDCNFGMLCTKCNIRIPANNRKEWLKKVTKYVNKS